MSMMTLNPFSIPIATKEDVSDEIKKVKKVAAETYAVLVVCLVYNLVAVSALWTRGVVETRIMCLATAYYLLGVPAARFSWLRELNLAFDGDRCFVYRRFLVAFIIHIVFCSFACVDPFAEKSLAGIMSGIDVYFGDGLGYNGFFYFVVAIFFCIELLMSTWVLFYVHKLYIQGAFSYGDSYGYLEGTNGPSNV